jgi:iron complex outermembrane receptor protein
MDTRRRVASFAFCLTLLLGLASSPLIAFADTRADATANTNALANAPVRFDLPAEALDKALRDFAIQAHCNISYEPSLVSGLRTPAIQGMFRPSDALSLLLKATRLRAVHINEDTIQVLGRAASTSINPPATDTAPLPAATLRLAALGPNSPSTPTTTADSSTNTTTSSAPEPDKNLEEIVVTGTNIRGVENKTVPLLTFDRDAIDRSGYSNLADFITALPQNVKSGPNSADGMLSGVSGIFNNFENSTAANLRGLGASSTLTLIDGHRVAASSAGTGVDLSMIPLSAVERIDVLTDGSSAVYGADAVGGVVNIILRKDFNGQETSARLDTLARGGGELKQISQSAGRSWGNGGVLGVFQFDDSNAIRSDQRSFTAALPPPTDVYPATKRYSAVLNGHQFLVDSVEVFADGLYQHNSGHRSFTDGRLTQVFDSSTNSTAANAGIRWQPFGDWHLEGNGLFSRVNTLSSEIFTPAEPPYVNGQPYARVIDTIKEGDLKLDGTLWSSGTSSVKAAVGASYRLEEFSVEEVFANVTLPTSSHVHAVFAELYAPLITNANGIPGIRKLDISAAVRSDSYSDFGTKTNPRFGVYWAPIDQLGFRAAYSTSFRAPDPTALFDAKLATRAVIESGYPQPGDPSGNTPVLFFGNPTLRPETSKNITAGLDFTPTAIPNTRLSVNYYRIIYSNRIVVPPINAGIFLNPQIYGPLIKQFPDDAAVEAFVASLNPPQQLFDLSPGQTGLAGIRYGYAYTVTNAAKETTEGVDFGAHSLIALSSTDKLVLDFNATYIRELETTFCDICTSTELVNTYGQPLKFRLRAGGGWSNGIISTNAAANYANGYADTNLLPPGRIASFTTLDLNASWLIRATGTTLSLSIINALNSDAPHTSFSLENVNYDPTNADPRGRIVSLQIRQLW